ncbi:MAG: type II toxin-antitoxin system HicB family antitoxin [Phycisphaeraceae bacterium]
MMNTIYPIVIHKEPRSCYGVSVPDLPGCTSTGDTLDEAMAMAKEAILGHIEVMMEKGYAIPESRPIEEHRRNPDFADAALWAVVEIDPSDLPGNAVRVNISMQERTLNMIDTAARKAHLTRSGLLEKAATRYIQSELGRRVQPARHPAKRTRKVHI